VYLVSIIQSVSHKTITGILKKINLNYSDYFSSKPNKSLAKYKIYKFKQGE